MRMKYKEWKNKRCKKTNGEMLTKLFLVSIPFVGIIALIIFLFIRDRDGFEDIWRKE